MHRSELNTKIPLYMKKIKQEKIRQNMLLIKYGRIYLSKVFGNVCPSDAVKHYQNKLMEVVFYSWKVFWWNSRVLWRLKLRANCHYRFYLAKKTFVVWQKYVTFQQIERQKVLSAQSHCKKKTMIAVLKQFKKHCELSKCLKANKRLKIQIFTIAVEKYYILCKMNTFVSEKIVYAINTMRSIQRQRKYWIMWKEFTARRKEEREKESSAKAINDRRIICTTFYKWQKYVHFKRTKNQLLKVADEIYKENILATYFQMWSKCYADMIWQNRVMHQLKRDYDRKQLLLYFNCWQKYVKHIQMLRAIDAYANMKLKRHMFKRMRNIVEMKAQSREYHRLSVLSRVWQVWTCAVDQADERRDRASIGKAKLFYRQKILERIFKKLQGHAILTKKKMEMKNKTMNIIRLRYFQTWYDCWQNKLYINHLENQANGFHQMICLQHAFGAWRQQYIQTVELDERQSIAANYHTRSMLKKCFKVWHTWTHNRKQMRMREEQVRMHNQQKTKWLCLQTWRNMVLEQRNIKMQIKESIEHHNIKLNRKCLTSWLFYHRYCALVNAKAHELAQKHGCKTLQRTFQMWLKHTRHQKQRQKEERAAVASYRSRLIRRVWTQWVLFVEYRQQKKSDKSRLQQPVQQVKIIMLRGYFCRWYKTHSQLIKAELHYSRTLKVTFFNLWLQKHFQQAAVAKHKITLKKMYQTVICQRWMDVWTRHYQQQLVIQRAQEVALEVWSSKIKIKVFRLWFRFAKYCREEKKKSFMRARLLAAEANENKALQYAIRLAKEEFYIARKYYTRWCNRVWRKKENENTNLLGAARVTCITTKHDFLHNVKCVYDKRYLSDSEQNPTQAESRKHANKALNRPKPRIPSFLQTSISDNNNHHNNRERRKARNLVFTDPPQLLNYRPIKKHPKPQPRTLIPRGEIIALSQGNLLHSTDSSYIIQNEVNALDSSLLLQVPDQLLPPSYFA